MPFLFQLDVNFLRSWTVVDDIQVLANKLKIPQLSAESFHQLYEISSSIHAFRKALSHSSYIRRFEVESMENIENFKEYENLLKQPVEQFQIYTCRVTKPTAEYQKLVAKGVLTEWEGM